MEIYVATTDDGHVFCASQSEDKCVEAIKERQGSVGVLQDEGWTDGYYEARTFTVDGAIYYSIQKVKVE